MGQCAGKGNDASPGQEAAAAGADTSQQQQAAQVVIHTEKKVCGILFEDEKSRRIVGTVEGTAAEKLHLDRYAGETVLSNAPGEEGGWELIVSCKRGGKSRRAERAHSYSPRPLLSASPGAPPPPEPLPSTASTLPDASPFSTAQKKRASTATGQATVPSPSSSAPFSPIPIPLPSIDTFPDAVPSPRATGRSKTKGSVPSKPALHGVKGRADGSPKPRLSTDPFAGSGGAVGAKPGIFERIRFRRGTSSPQTEKGVGTAPDSCVLDSAPLSPPIIDMGQHKPETTATDLPSSSTCVDVQVPRMRADDNAPGAGALAEDDTTMCDPTAQPPPLGTAVPAPEGLDMPNPPSSPLRQDSSPSCCSSPPKHAPAQHEHAPQASDALKDEMNDLKALLSTAKAQAKDLVDELRERGSHERDRERVRSLERDMPVYGRPSPAPMSPPPLLYSALSPAVVPKRPYLMSPQRIRSPVL
eukprot:TRINITY_DN27519_c0_g1_i1.p1 TRINITY_DN27519_c0_g1~~TRINITY_DN27519_c0_g1_i1.p1  ORF type:complete len:471 (+),score=56.35 TRINITY_DN27519_c0_g1_i1:51-1463(+)